MNKQKGFTIIELIVVIAIIAVLAAIVLVNVTQYIAKGKDAAIKGNLATLLTNSAVYFSDINHSATNADAFVLDTTFGCNGPVNAAITNAGGTLTCTSSSSTGAWCAVSTTPIGGNFCVDSTGFKGANKACSSPFNCH
jgi:type IV pilus assembly protein PilA